MSAPIISFVYPIKNRSSLLRHTLCSLSLQDDKRFEVIVVDYGSDDGLPDVISWGRTQSLNIRCYVVDPARCEFSHSNEKHRGMYGPGMGLNVGARKAEGSLLALTSPEVVNAQTNVGVAIDSFGDGLDDQWTGEVFYRINLGKHFAVTPDVQVLVNPALDPDKDIIGIFGLRARLI